MGVIESLHRRYATKRFDPKKTISKEDLQRIKDAIQLSPSSYGLQAFKVLIISNQGLKAQLQASSWGQKQVPESSHLLVFCSHRDMTDKLITSMMDKRRKLWNLDEKAVRAYGEKVRTKVGKKSPEEQKEWSARQIFIALANVLTLCGELGIDACPMEGFEPEDYDELLELEQQNLTSVVLCALGYRSDEDRGPMPKIRRDQQDLFVEII